MLNFKKQVKFTYKDHDYTWQGTYVQDTFIVDGKKINKELKQGQLSLIL